MQNYGPQASPTFFLSRDVAVYRCLVNRFVDSSIYFQLSCLAYLSRGYEEYLKKAREVSEIVHIGLLLFRVLHQPIRR